MIGVTFRLVGDVTISSVFEETSFEEVENYIALCTQNHQPVSLGPVCIMPHQILYAAEMADESVAYLKALKNPIIIRDHAMPARDEFSDDDDIDETLN